MTECSKLVSKTSFNSSCLMGLPGILVHVGTRSLCCHSCYTWEFKFSLRFPRKISSDVILTTNRTQVNVDETLALAKIVEENSKKICVNAEQMLHQLQEISRIITGSSKKTDVMIKGIQQLKDQSAIWFQQKDLSKQHHIDETSSQILANTALILEHLQQLCSRLNQSGTGIGVGNVGAEKTTKSLHQLSFELERSVQSHMSNQNTQNMKVITNKLVD